MIIRINLYGDKLEYAYCQHVSGKLPHLRRINQHIGTVASCRITWKYRAPLRISRKCDCIQWNRRLYCKVYIGDGVDREAQDGQLEHRSAVAALRFCHSSLSPHRGQNCTNKHFSLCLPLFTCNTCNSIYHVCSKEEIKTHSISIKEN